MLLWEALATYTEPRSNETDGHDPVEHATTRLPHDRRCAATTKAGHRCRARILAGKEHCTFHNPDITAERRRQHSARGGRARHRLDRMPDGYLRKLSDRRSIGTAMDRLYREVRLGIVTPEMGGVLSGILTRLLDSDLCKAAAANGRSKAEKVRPKLSLALTRAERTAWKKALTNSTVQLLDPPSAIKTQPLTHNVAARISATEVIASPHTLDFPLAS